MQLPNGLTWIQNFNKSNAGEFGALLKLTWPRFLIEKSDIPTPPKTLPHRTSPDAMLYFGIESKNQLIAVVSANFMQLPHHNVSELPDTGWEWAMESCDARSKGNAMCLLSATIHPNFRGKGLARVLLEKAKTIAIERKCNLMIAPVRPSKKDEFPFQSMDEYLQKKDKDGRIYDPWLRLHLSCGARQLNVCNNSVSVSATLPRWLEWTGISFKNCNQYALPGGLSPLQIDHEKGIGTYIEPNVWVKYDLEASLSQLSNF